MNVMYKKFNQICRVCMLEDSLMFSIFGKTSLNNDICAMIMYCSAIKVDAGDGMPDLLCSSCLQRLEVAYSFKQDCEQSDMKLRNLLNENVHTTECNIQLCHIKTEVDDDITGTSFECDKIDVNSVVKVEIDDEIFTAKENDENICNEEIEEKQYNLRNTSNKMKVKKKRKQTKSKIKILRRRPIFECKVCNKTFDQHKRFWLHKQIHPFYSCYVCWEEFDSLQILEDHQKIHLDDVYICDEESCELQFNSCKLFVMHKKNDHNILNYLHCNKCEKTFGSHEKWDIHVRKHLRQQSFKCPVCSKRFTRQCYIDTHMKVHSKKYKCDKCDRAYTSSSKLQVHKNTHCQDKSFACTDCSKKFAQRYNLDRHINVVHKGMKPAKREKKHLCPHCGQVFARPVDLTIHIRLHTGVKPYSCDSCEYRCHDKQLLKSHVRKHSGLRPYKCSYCEKAFGSRSYLTIHERFHSGYRPYICSKCSKGFTNSKDLKVHERTHTGIKLFHCTTCNNSFTTLHYLRVHMKKHDSQ